MAAAFDCAAISWKNHPELSSADQLTMRISKPLCFIILTAVLALVACTQTTDQPTAITGQAAVAMPDRYGAQVSARILAAGGNAVDAAIAAGFALAVTFPAAGNIGGGGFMLIHMDGENSFLDYREKAPLAAHRDMYLDPQGNVIPGASLIGHLSVGVPGTVAGFQAAHEKYGSLPWKDLLMPAVRLAEEGFEVGERQGGGMLSRVEKYEGKTNFSDYFGNVAPGSVHKQPELAATLRRIAEQGADGFYRGKTAQLIVAEMQRGNGLITLEDLEKYESKWREPIRGRWRDYDVLSAPPPSSGGFALIQMLKMKDYSAELFDGLEQNSAQYIHLVAEIEKRVFADRARYLGDPDFVDNRIEHLISDDYIRSRARDIDPVNISMDVGPGTELDTHDTTHYSVLDKWGNAVSNTYTLNLGYGSGVVVEGAGFLLNDEMDDFSVKPGVPNIYGVVGSEANEIQPEKRMLSSMTPTILLRDSEVAMVLGTPGGSTIFTSVFQTIVNIIDFDMNPLEAAGAPRFHHQLLPPDLVMYGPSRPLEPDVVAELQRRGYRLKAPFDFGDIQVIYDNGSIVRAASDPRNSGESRVLEAAQE